LSVLSEIPIILDSDRSFCRVRDLTANIFGKKQDIQIGKRQWKLQRGRYTQSHNFTTFGPQKSKSKIVVFTYHP